MDRRGWQVLASLSGGPAPRADLVSTLASFDPPAVVEEVVDRLISRGWIEGSADLVMLTGRYRSARSPGSLVEGVRQ